MDAGTTPNPFIDPDGWKRVLANGENVFLRDVWPTMEEVSALMQAALDPETYRTLYANFAEQNPMWNEIPTTTGLTYQWDPESTYIQEPPFFEGFGAEVGKMEDLHGTRPLAIFGDSVTTDHISPAGAIKATSPAGVYLQERGVTPLVTGRVIVATLHPYETTVVEVIRKLGLELQVIFNKGAVMILPAGVNKGTGLTIQPGLTREKV